MISNLYIHVNEDTYNVGRWVKLRTRSDTHDYKLLLHGLHTGTELGDIGPIQATAGTRSISGWKKFKRPLRQQLTRYNSSAGFLSVPLERLERLGGLEEQKQLLDPRQ